MLLKNLNFKNSMVFFIYHACCMQVSTSISKDKSSPCIILEEEFLPTNTTNWLGFVYNTSQNDKYFVGHHRQSVPFQKLVLYKFATIDILSFFPNSIWEVFSGDVSLATSPRYNSSSCYILILV